MELKTDKSSTYNAYKDQDTLFTLLEVLSLVKENIPYENSLSEGRENLDEWKLTPRGFPQRPAMENPDLCDIGFPAVLMNYSFTPVI